MTECLYPWSSIAFGLSLLNIALKLEKFEELCVLEELEVTIRLNTILAHHCQSCRIVEGLMFKTKILALGIVELSVPQGWIAYSFGRPGNVHSVISSGITWECPFNLYQWFQRSSVTRCCVGMCPSGWYGCCCLVKLPDSFKYLQQK